jgi:hypothetical protein
MCSYTYLILNNFLIWISGATILSKNYSNLVLVDRYTTYIIILFFLLKTPKYVNPITLTSFIFIKGVKNKHNNGSSSSIKPDLDKTLYNATSSIRLCQHTFNNRGKKKCLKRVVGNTKYCFKHCVTAYDNLTNGMQLDSNTCVFLTPKIHAVKLCNKKSLTIYQNKGNKLIFNTFILNLISCDYISWNFINYFSSLSDTFYPPRCGLTLNSRIVMHSFVQNYYP